MRPKGRPNWTPQEMQIAFSMREEGKTYAEIGLRVNRTANAVESKMSYERTTWTRNVVTSERPTLDVLNDRLRRLLASQQMSTTALLMGDPEPGRSALDRRDHG